MLDIVQELEATGQSLQHFSRELSRYWRNLLVAKLSGKPTRLIAASDQEQVALLETAAQFSEEDLTRYLNLTLDLYKALQYSLQPRLHLELGLIKLVHAGRLQSIESALAGLGKAPAAECFGTSRRAAPAGLSSSCADQRRSRCNCRSSHQRAARCSRSADRRSAARSARGAHERRLELQRRRDSAIRCFACKVPNF